MIPKEADKYMRYRSVRPKVYYPTPNHFHDYRRMADNTIKMFQRSKTYQAVAGAIDAILVIGILIVSGLILFMLIHWGYIG